MTLRHVSLNPKTINMLASALALILVVLTVWVAALVFFTGKDFWFSFIAGSFFAVTVAVGAWYGSNKDGTESLASLSWQAWIGMFFGMFILGLVFVGIDILVVHPGLSLVFTLCAIALALIALPSALRAWIVERYSRQAASEIKKQAQTHD